MQFKNKRWFNKRQRDDRSTTANMVDVYASMCRNKFSNAKLNSVNFTISEQHKDLSKLRQDQDTKDIALVVSYFEDKNPFVNGKHLMNIADGVIAASNVNLDQAKSIGEMIMQSMMGKNAL